MTQLRSFMCSFIRFKRKLLQQKGHRWRSNTTEQASINTTIKRCSFKAFRSIVMSLTADPAACTANSEYRISPVFGFVDPSGSKDIVITRTAGAPKEDKLVIHFANAPADATDAQAAFAALTPAGNITIPMSATS
uniref:Major sperm protein n=1 Tax=Caenorhabditis japonica TaxID=281687 RepID=A0A8R1ISG4_CAEJA